MTLNLFGHTSSRLYIKHLNIKFDNLSKFYQSKYRAIWLCTCHIATENQMCCNFYIYQFKKGNRDRKDISYLKIKKVHKQEGWIGLLKVKKVWKQEG